MCTRCDALSLHAALPSWKDLIEARAFDGDGVPQTDEYAPVAPHGAQGYPRLTINVEST